ncbi:MAG: response regulator transcription factor [Thermoleophilia bacterium]|nr:response regulator transcription factor [Thermoleophilia bacterium]
MGSTDEQPFILIAEDEPNIASFAKMYLEAAGFRVDVAERGDDALESIAAERPDLLLLDLNLPGVDGFEVTRRIRQGDARAMPILMLTARDDAVDKVVGLELGADDYVTKPFDPRELVARVRAVLRRSDGRADAAGDDDMPPVLEVDDLRIEVGPREVFVKGDAVALTPKEFDLLTALVQARGLVLSREQLLEKVWGYTFLGDSRTIDVHVRQLRRKLGDTCPIETVWGTGYKVPARR